MFTTGYRADLTRVPYLQTLIKNIQLVDGFPVLGEFFGTTIPDLYIICFSATQDFSPFFGFVKASPAAATLIVGDVTSHN